MRDLVFWLDLAGVAVFAASGALVASRKQLDLVGFVLVAAVTGVGGGTLRDLLIGRDSVFWLHQPIYLWTITGVALLVFLTAHLVESRFRVLLWADALGMALFAALGAEIALAADVPPAVAVLLGVMPAAFGGIIRDVLCNETPLILRREIYATAAAAGAGATVLLDALAVGRPWTLLGGAAVAFAIRGASLRWGFSLPVYKPRPGRDYPSP